MVTPSGRWTTERAIVRPGIGSTYFGTRKYSSKSCSHLTGHDHSSNRPSSVPIAMARRPTADRKTPGRASPRSATGDSPNGKYAMVPPAESAPARCASTVPMLSGDSMRSSAAAPPAARNFLSGIRWRARLEHARLDSAHEGETGQANDRRVRITRGRLPELVLEATHEREPIALEAHVRRHGHDDAAHHRDHVNLRDAGIEDRLAQVELDAPHEGERIDLFRHGPGATPNDPTHHRDVVAVLRNAPADGRTGSGLRSQRRKTGQHLIERLGGARGVRTLQPRLQLLEGELVARVVNAQTLHGALAGAIEAGGRNGAFGHGALR